MYIKIFNPVRLHWLRKPSATLIASTYSCNWLRSLYWSRQVSWHGVSQPRTKDSAFRSKKGNMSQCLVSVDILVGKDSKLRKVKSWGWWWGGSVIFQPIRNCICGSCVGGLRLPTISIELPVNLTEPDNVFVTS